MNKTCHQCQQTFTITSSDQDFYKRMDVPEPTLCPNCRQQRRLAWRNERSLYPGTCQLCKKKIISLYSPNKPYTIYCQDCWLSDKWNVFDYAKPYNPNQSFFQQYQALQLAVPRMAITIRNCENSDYAPWAADGKNLYLSAGGFRNENCLYGMFPTYSQDCMDFIMPYKCELCYEVIECSDCYHCLFSQRCANCRDCYFSYNLRSCQDCFGCVNLRNKQFCWFNEQLTETEYKQRLHKMQWTHQTIADCRSQLAKFKLTQPHQASEQINCEDCTGDLMKGCNQTKYGFDVYDQEQTAYVFDVRETKDSRDLYTGAFGNELTYECHSALQTQRGISLNVCWDGNYNLYYSDHCFTSHDLFGCIGLRKQQFCILNTQYSETDYKQLKQKIISDMKRSGEWGEFFPISTAPFAYNETVAQEYFPLTEAQVRANGWPWHEPDPADYKPAQGDILACQDCQKNYRLVPAELGYYKQFGMPQPILCPQCRHLARMKLRNPRQLWQRHCAKCNDTITTTYAPDRPEIIYCQTCFQKEMY